MSSSSDNRISDADERAIYSGNDGRNPTLIRELLGWLEPSDEEVIPKLIGAVMSLCLTAHQQQAEIERLRSMLGEDQ